MEIAVTNVPKYGGYDTGDFNICLGFFNTLSQPGNGYANIGAHKFVARKKRKGCGGSIRTNTPQFSPAGFIFFPKEFLHLILPGILFYFLNLRFYCFGWTVELQEKRWLFGIFHSRIPVNSPHHERIQEFNLGNVNAFLNGFDGGVNSSFYIW